MSSLLLLIHKPCLNSTSEGVPADLWPSVSGTPLNIRCNGSEVLDIPSEPVLPRISNTRHSRDTSGTAWDTRQGAGSGLPRSHLPEAQLQVTFRTSGSPTVVCFLMPGQPGKKPSQLAHPTVRVSDSGLGGPKNLHCQQILERC